LRWGKNAKQGSLNREMKVWARNVEYKDRRRNRVEERIVGERSTKVVGGEVRLLE